MIIQAAYTDMAGKYRVVVEVDATRSIPLKYESIVSNSVAFADAQKVLDREAEQALLNSWTPIDYEL